MRKSVALALIQLGFLAACGGGGGGLTTPPPTPNNVETVTVDAGPPAATFTAVNTPFISVKVCVPGTSCGLRCVTSFFSLFNSVTNCTVPPPAGMREIGRVKSSAA